MNSTFLEYLVLKNENIKYLIEYIKLSILYLIFNIKKRYIIFSKYL